MAPPSTTPQRPGRSRTRKNLLATALVLVLTWTLSPSVAAAPTDESRAEAQVIESRLLDTQLVDAVGSSSGYPSDPGEELSPADLEALGTLSLSLGTVNLPLLGTPSNPGLLDLTEAGALNAYTHTPDAENAVAGAGAVGADGAIALHNPRDPGTPRNTTVQLSHLLNQLEVEGLTDHFVQRLDLELGAIASTATQTAPGAPVSDYVVADGRLLIDSPAISELSQAVRTSVVKEVGGSVTASTAKEGAIGQLVQELTRQPLDLGAATLRLSEGTVGVEGLDAALTAVADSVLNQPLTDSRKLVSVNMADGVITVDLAKVVKGPDGTSLNGLPANTEVLTPATISAITAAVTEALGSIAGPLSQGAADALATSTLTIALPAELRVLTSRSTGHLVISGTLADFAGTTGTAPRIEMRFLDPLGLSVDTLLGSLTTILKTMLLAPMQDVVRGLLSTAPARSATSIQQELVDPLLTSLTPVLDGVLRQALRLTVNDQPSPGLLGEGSFTVRAVSMTLLPAGPAAEVHLASSTVRTRALADPVGDPAPDRVTVVQGQEITFDVLANDGAAAEAAGFTRAQAHAAPKLIGDATGPVPASTVHGSITCGDSGTDRGRCTYRSLDFYTGTDGFDYALVQPDRTWNVHVEITVVPTNHAPTAREDRAVATTGGPPVTIRPLANDTDPDAADEPVVDGFTAPGDARGEFGCTDTVCTYTPADDGWTGVLEFSYTITDRATEEPGPRTAASTIRVFVDPPPLTSHGFHDRATTGATAATGRWDETTTITTTPMCTAGRPATRIDRQAGDAATGWVLERRLIATEPSPWETVASLDGEVTEFTDTRLGEGRTYQWRARPDLHRWSGTPSAATETATATQPAAASAVGC